MDKKNNNENLRIDRFKYFDMKTQRKIGALFESDLADEEEKSNYHFFLIASTSKSLSKLSIQSSALLRFIEILHLLRISISGLIEEYSILNSNDDSLSSDEIKKKILQDIPRSKNIHKSLIPFINALVSYIENNDEEITQKPNYIQLVISHFIESPQQIIFNYNDYKQFITHFFNELRDELKIDTHEKFFVVQYLRDYQQHDFLIWKEVILDITYDQIPTNNIFSDVQYDVTGEVCKQLISAYITPKTLPLANMIRANWDILRRIYDDKPLQDYLFELLRNDDLNNMPIDDNVLDSIYRSGPFTILKKSMKYAYLLNYSFLDSPHHSFSSTEKFFMNTLKEDSKFTFFVFSRYISLLRISPHVIQLLYYYACGCL